MHGRTLSILSGLIFALGCSDQSTPTDTGRAPARPDGANFTFPTDRYPTEEEWLAEGLSLDGEASADNPSASFSANQWKAKATVYFKSANHLSATLSASIISNTNGATLNSGSVTEGFSMYRPQNVSVDNRELNVAISQLNKTCGITGKANVQGSVGLKLVNNPTEISEVWSQPINKPAPDVTLPECRADEDEIVASGCSTQIVYDPANCSGGGGGGGEGGGGGGGGECEWWVRIVSYSTDGGETWYEESRTYFLVC